MTTKTTEQAIALIELALEKAETATIKDLKRCKENLNRKQILAEFDALERIATKVKAIIQDDKRGY